jgi:hypothetical protein
MKAMVELRIGRTFCILLIFLFLHACAPTLPPMQEELMSKAVPVYEGRFSPIQGPVQLEYKPVSMTLAGHFALHTSVRDKDEILSGELLGTLRVSPMGDSNSKTRSWGRRSSPPRVPRSWNSGRGETGMG